MAKTDVGQAIKKVRVSVNHSCGGWCAVLVSSPSHSQFSMLLIMQKYSRIWEWPGYNYLFVESFLCWSVNIIIVLQPVPTSGYFLQGAEVVREDLIDEIAKESGPYQPPEKILRRSDMATDFSTPQQRIIKPNE